MKFLAAEGELRRECRVARARRGSLPSIFSNVSNAIFASCSPYMERKCGEGPSVFTRAAKINDAGDFEIPYLNAGTYRMTAPPPAGVRRVR